MSTVKELPVAADEAFGSLLDPSNALREDMLSPANSGMAVAMSAPKLSKVMQNFPQMIIQDGPSTAAVDARFDALVAKNVG